MGHYSFGSTAIERTDLDEASRHYYETTMSEWLAVEAIVRQRDKEKTAHAVAKLSSESGSGDKTKGIDIDGDIENDVFEDNGYSDLSDQEDPSEDPSGSGKVIVKHNSEDVSVATPIVASPIQPISVVNLIFNENTNNENNECEEKDVQSNKSSPSTSSYVTVANDIPEYPSPKSENNYCGAVIITDASVDVGGQLDILSIPDSEIICVSTVKINDIVTNEDVTVMGSKVAHTSLDALQEPRSVCVSPASSNGGIYSV